MRIPKSIAQQAGVSERDELEIDVEDEVIRLRPRRRPPPLEQLLARITPENQHGEEDFGRPQGREV